MLPTDLVNHKSISQEPCFASRPGGEASTVLQVALLAKQAFSRREPSSCQSWDDPLLSLLEVLRPREEGRSTLFSQSQLGGRGRPMMMPLFSVSSRFSDRGRKGAPLFSVSIGRPRPMMMPLFSVSSRFSDRGRKGAPLFSVSIGRPRPMMMPLFSVSSRFSDRGRKGAPLFSVSIGRPRPMMMPLSKSGGRGR